MIFRLHSYSLAAMVAATAVLPTALAAQSAPSRLPQLHAFASFGYTYNASGHAAPNGLRVFDAQSAAAGLDVLELSSEWRPAPLFGVRLDYAFGDRIPAKSASNGLKLGPRSDLQQLFATIGSSTAALDLGKFVTPLGIEVIEGFDGFNDQYSRGLLFNFALPFTHTGARFTWTVSDASKVVALGVLGWDNVDVHRDRWSLGGQFVHKVSSITMAAGYLGGSEPGASGPVTRQIVDVITSWAAPRDVTVSGEATVGTDDDAMWAAGAIFGTSPPLGPLKLTARAEAFDDAGGTRFGAGPETRAYEVSVSPTLRLSSRAAFRIEVRRDWSNTAVFAARRGAYGKSQTTIATNLVLHF